MTFTRIVAAAALLALIGSEALAQGGPPGGPGPGASAPRMGMGMGMGPGPGASGPRMGMGPGPAASGPRMGMGPGGGMRQGGGPRWGADHTPGWSMMTPEERASHQERMRSLKTHDECTAYMEQHRQQMAERAKSKGATPPAGPRRDACAGMK